MMGLQKYLIDGSENVLLAHKAEMESIQESETLAEHSERTIYFLQQLLEQNGLSIAVSKIVEHLTVEDEHLCSSAQQMIIKWFMQAIYLHDLGKINPAFQKKKMHNQKLDKVPMPGDSTHSLLSALLYIDIHIQELEGAQFSDDCKRNRSICQFMKQVLYAFAYVISRHHTYLGNLEEMDGERTRFEEQLKMLQEAIERCPSYIHYYQHKERFLHKKSVNSVANIYIIENLSKSKNKRFNDMHSPFPFYVLTKLLYSTLVACDFYATNEFDTGEKMQFKYFSKENELQPLLDAFQNTDIYRGVQAFRNNPESDKIAPINKLRSALFDETEKQLLLNLEQYLYYLEAPTGSGKTYMSINLGLKLLSSGLGMNKLIYVFPFNALIEQTKQTLDMIFPNDVQRENRITVVNSVTPIVTKKELAAEQVQANGRGDCEPDIDYKSELLQRQMLQYPVTLTSHVNFFNYLFGVGRESNLAFTHLCNSVIILDEIQSYKNDIWKEIIHFLRNFAELMNMKIIIMSATLPNLDKLVEAEVTESCSLVVNRDIYFKNPIFRDRVQLHFELLNNKERKIDEDTLLAKVQQVLEDRQEQEKSTRLFIEFITKATAKSFYQRLRSMNLGIPLFELTGDDSNLLRKRTLKQLGKDEAGNFYMHNVIVVATQVIEAGVDIDMDIGFKDISILDSEEQFLGRINRSCLRDDCHAYFFNMVRTTMIYRDDLRTEKDLQSSEDYQKILLEKDFSGFYRLVMDRINETRQKANPKNWLYFTEAVKQLQFKEVEKKMQLITDKHYTLFIDYTLTYIDAGVTFELQGSQIWQEFKELLLDKELGYAERIVKLSQMKEKMSYFTYNYGIQHKPKLDTPGIYTELIGSLFYVPDGERFMELDENTNTKKFNSQAYRAEEDSQFL